MTYLDVINSEKLISQSGKDPFLFISDILDSEEPREELAEKMSIMQDNLLSFEKSKKHMVDRELGRMEPTESLKYKKAA